MVNKKLVLRIVDEAFVTNDADDRLDPQVTHFVRGELTFGGKRLGAQFTVKQLLLGV